VVIAKNIVPDRAGGRDRQMYNGGSERAVVRSVFNSSSRFVCCFLSFFLHNQISIDRHRSAVARALLDGRFGERHPEVAGLAELVVVQLYQGRDGLVD
jgi:hypothetical protein